MQCHLNHGGWCHLLECNWLIFVVHFGPFEAHFWPQILSNACPDFKHTIAGSDQADIDQDPIIKEQEGLDQLLRLHFDLTKVEQSTFNIDISEGKDQQHKKVFPIVFYDPVADYLELMRSIDIKILLSEES